jgi:hypothetical protein
MIVRTHINFRISGVDLIPKQIENEFDISFSEVSLKGDLHTNGRFKGEPRTESSAQYSTDLEYYSDTDTEISRLADLEAQINDKAKEYGIEDSVYYICFYYAAQCALSLEQKTFSALSKLQFVNIDCIKLYDSYETKKSGDKETIWFYSDGKLEKEVTRIIDV